MYNLYKRVRTATTKGYELQVGEALRSDGNFHNFRLHNMLKSKYIAPIAQMDRARAF